MAKTENRQNFLHDYTKQAKKQSKHLQMKKVT